MAIPLPPAQVLSSQTPVQNSTPLLITSRQGPHRKHISSTVTSICRIIKNLLPSNGNVFTEPWSRNGPGISVHLVDVVWQRLYTLQYSSQKSTTKQGAGWTRNRERICSNLNRDTGDPVVFLGPSRKIPGKCLNCVTTMSSNSSTVAIRRHMVLTLKASSKNPRKNETSLNKH
jgi:hypothetical protein